MAAVFVAMGVCWFMGYMTAKHPDDSRVAGDEWDGDTGDWTDE